MPENNDERFDEDGVSEERDPAPDLDAEEIEDYLYYKREVQERSDGLG
jgi:hypothetical protein